MAAAGLAFAEHGLTENVDVERVPLRRPGPQVTGQLLGIGVDDEVAHQSPHPPLGYGHHELRQPGAEPGSRAQQHPIHRRQECGQRGLRHQRGELAGGDGGILGSDDAVHEPHGEGGGGLVGNHSSQPPGRNAVPPRRGAAGGIEPSTYPLDGLVGQRFTVVGADVHSSLAPSCREQPLPTRPRLSKRTFRRREPLTDA